MLLEQNITWDKIPELIKNEVKQLDLILSNFPYIKDRVNTHTLGIMLTDKFARMLNKANLQDTKAIAVKNSLANFNYVNFYEDIDRFRDAIMFGDKDEQGKLRYQWLKFKTRYVVWARNFIHKLNAIKQREAPWLDVRQFAEEIAQLEMSESLSKDVYSICEKLKTHSETDEMIEELIEDMLLSMLKEVEKAEVSTSLNRDSNGHVVGRTYDNTYPKWYRTLGVKNKDHFKQVIKRKSGPVYKRIEDIAKDRLLNGFKSKDDYDLPNNTYRALIGLGAYDDNDEEVPF